MIHGMLWLTYGLDSTFDVVCGESNQVGNDGGILKEGGGGNSMQDDCMHASH